MKKLLTLTVLFFCTTLFAQDITGTWNGLLKFPGGQLRLAFNISQTESGYTATMDSPDQQAKGIPVTTVAFENNTLAMAIPEGNIAYRGTFENNTITGTFTQNGNTIPLNLVRDEIKVEKPKRPQEPIAPFPYYSEDITFKNEKAGITLAGTLTLPKKEGNFPAVVLISGSGPQNRDEELLGHKPFLVLADYLTKNGIAVLRYDDRGVAQSQGSFATATTADFATDAEAAFHYLKTRKEINKKEIGLLGHSEGGTIAPMVNEKNPDVAFIVLMAGTAIPGDELMTLQNYTISKANGMPEEELAKINAITRKTYAVVKQDISRQEMKTKLQAVYNEELKPLFASKGIPEKEINQYTDMQIEELTSPWYVYFIRYNPIPVLEKVKCPMLALNGEKDLQVTPTANLESIARAAQKSGNKNVTTKKLPGLNHLFQECTTGTMAEYGEIEQTISPVALNEICGWIKNVTK